MNLRMNADASVLVLVDYQQRLLPAIHEGARVVEQAVRLGRIAHELDVPVIGTEQNPRGLGPNFEAVRTLCRRTLAKTHFDACQDGLLDAVREARAPAAVTDVVLSGCEAHVCLLQTALGLVRAGFRLWVVSDACGSRLAASHELAMQRLRQAGAMIVTVEMVAFEWLDTCNNPHFKAVLQRLKDG